MIPDSIDPKDAPEVLPIDRLDHERLRRVACFIDVPNLETSAYQVGAECDPNEIIKVAAAHGNVVIAKAYGFATVKKPISRGVMAAFRAGFEFIPTVLIEEGRKDVDTRMTSDIVQALYESNIDIIVVASGDSDYIPALRLARQKGKMIIVVAIEDCLSPGLTHEANHVIIIPKKTVVDESISDGKSMVLV